MVLQENKINSNELHIIRVTNVLLEEPRKIEVYSNGREKEVVQGKRARGGKKFITYGFQRLQCSIIWRKSS